MKKTNLLENLSSVSAEKYIAILTNTTFADLDSGAVLDYANPDNLDDKGRAIVLVLEDSKFGKLARIIWTDTYEQDYILGITKIDGREWTLLSR